MLIFAKQKSEAHAAKEEGRYITKTYHAQLHECFDEINVSPSNSILVHIGTSSGAARKFLEFVSDCGSSGEVEFGGNAPSCSSLELRSDGSNESVGSTSSVE